MKNLEDMVVERLRPATLSENLIIRESVKAAKLEVVKAFKEHLTSGLNTLQAESDPIGGWREGRIKVSGLIDMLDKFESK